ncbi:CPBP family intramembrane glutamic endopeptidase [Marmoricola sp. RAF53]|uniref:CPBP family intramembrane glutamic endopeptidase n=1 Tax=Marmoricola sp. RAF53 TaxID=3233059 RepID=UPI003F971360
MVQRPGGPGYALTLRTATYRWWRPVVGILLLFASAVLFAPLLLQPLLAVTVWLDHDGSFTSAFTDAVALDPVSWQSMLYLNLSLAALVPVACFLVRFVHDVSPRFLASMTGSFRWRFFRVCLGLALVAIAAQLLVSMLLPGDLDGLGGPANDWTASTVAIAVVVLLTTPLQAIGEEYGFRGYLLQAFGALAARPWFGVVVSSLLFALAHGAQNLPLFLDRLTFGLIAGFIVVRTGGLEAGIALHVWNNLVAFGLALSLGSIDESLKVSDVSWWNIALTITQNGVYLVLVLFAARRMGVSPATTGVQKPPVLAPGTPSV